MRATRKSWKRRKIKNVIETLNNVQTQLDTLVKETHKAIIDTRVAFEKPDKESLESHKLYSVNKFYIMEENAFEKITKYNYEEYLNDDNIVAKFRCSLSE